MNSVSRTMATIAGDPVDRRVVIPVLSLYGARLSGCATARYFSDPAAYARGQAAAEEMIQPDVLLGPMAMALLGEAFGSELKEFPDAPPVVRRPAIGSAHEWAGITIPDPTQPRLRYLVESVRLMAAQTQGRRPI